MKLWFRPWGRRKTRRRRYTSPPEMAGERVKLQVQARESRGSAASRRLRAQGLIPGVLYGDGDTAHPFAIEERELRKALTGDCLLYTSDAADE